MRAFIFLFKLAIVALFFISIGFFLGRKTSPKPQEVLVYKEKTCPPIKAIVEKKQEEKKELPRENTEASNPSFNLPKIASKETKKEITPSQNSYLIQVGTFTDIDQAASLKEQLIKEYSPVKIFNEKTSSGSIFPVYILNFNSYKKALKAKENIDKKFLVKSIIKKEK